MVILPKRLPREASLNKRRERSHYPKALAPESVCSTNDGLQFDMELDEPASQSQLPSPALRPQYIGADADLVPQSLSCDDASSRQRSAPSLVPSRARSSGQPRRSAIDIDHERAEKKPRRSGGSITPLSATSLSVSPSPSMQSPPTNALVPMEPADLQPATHLRSHEFQSGRRVFHVHFGHGYVASLETQPSPQSPTPQLERVLSAKTHNINVLFDNDKYKQIRLRAFYAVPKMVVIPSSSALRKRKLQQAVDGIFTSTPSRVSHVRELLSSNCIRTACELVLRWHLQHAFEPTQLLQRLVDVKEYNAAIRFAREFGLTKQYPAKVSPQPGWTLPLVLHRVHDPQRCSQAARQALLRRHIGEM